MFGWHYLADHHAFSNPELTGIFLSVCSCVLCTGMVRWIESFLKTGITRIVMDGFRSTEYEASTGIRQGTPSSLILYLFYNADLLDTTSNGVNTSSVGFIDDVAILAGGDSTEETCRLLETAAMKAQDWAVKHALVFAPDKSRSGTLREPEHGLIHSA